MPFDPTDPNSLAANQFISPLAGMAQDRSTGMLNQPQLRRFAPPAPVVINDGGTNSISPIAPTQNQINSMMPGSVMMAKGGILRLAEGSDEPVRGGLLEAGNIDLTKRPKVRNEDGTISTVRSMSFEENGKEVLIPTVVGDRVVSNKEAREHYRKTGEHLGKFTDPLHADRYARKLHEEQEQMYAPRGEYALGGLASQGDELAGIKNTIRQEFAARGLDFDRFISNPAVMDEVGKSIQSQGKNGDTILAHINPKEAQALKRMGGSGTINPATGLPQFAEDSSSSNQDSGYGGGYDSGGASFSDFGGSLVSEGGSMGGVSYNDGGADFGGQDVSGWTGGGNDGSSSGGGGTTTGLGITNISPTSVTDNILSPTGAGDTPISMGEGGAGATQAASSIQTLAGVDPATGLPVGTSNLSGLGQLASSSGIAPSLGAFAPTLSGISSVPVSGQDANLSDIAFESDMADANAVPAGGNISPPVVGYDPVNGNFIDANGNGFTVTASGQRQYNTFSTTAPTPGQTIVNAPGQQVEIMSPLQGAAILPTGMFSQSGYPVMQPAPSMVAKEQGQAPAAIEQAALQSPSVQETGLTGFESALGTQPTQSVLSALGSNDPALQMDAAMQIIGGGANMFNLAGDVFTTAQTALPDTTILDRRLAGMEKIGGAPQLGGADLTGTVQPEAPTMTAQATSLEDIMGTSPQGNYLFSGLNVTDQTIPNMATVNVPKAYELYNPVLAQPEDVYGGLVQKLTGVNPITKEQAIDPETGKPLPPTGTWVPGSTIDPKTGLPTTGVATWSTPETEIDAYNALIKQYEPALKLTPQHTITQSETNWGAPSAGLMPDVSSGVAPTTFAGLTPLSPLSPAQAVAERDSSPTVGPSTLDTLASSIPSIVSTANAATPNLFSPTTETTFQMPGTVPLPPTRLEEAPLFAGNIPVPTPRPASLDAAIAQAPPEVKAVVGTSTNPPANTTAPKTEYDAQAAALEDAGMIANGISKEEYADLMGVPVDQVKTRVTTAFGEPMAEYYTKSVGEALAGMTGGTTNTEGIMNLLSMTSPLGILSLIGKNIYNELKSPTTATETNVAAPDTGSAIGYTGGGGDSGGTSGSKTTSSKTVSPISVIADKTKTTTPPPSTESEVDFRKFLGLPIDYANYGYGGEHQYYTQNAAKGGPISALRAKRKI